jgi:hypothetical protein
MRVQHLPNWHERLTLRKKEEEKNFPKFLAIPWDFEENFFSDFFNAYSFGTSVQH